MHSHTIFCRTKASNYKPSYHVLFRAEHTLQMELLVLFHPTLGKSRSSGSTAAHCEWWMKWEISAQCTASSQIPPVLHCLLSRYLLCNFSERRSDNPSESICLKNKNRMLQFCPWASVVFYSILILFLPTSIQWTPLSGCIMDSKHKHLPLLVAQLQERFKGLIASSLTNLTTCTAWILLSENVSE